VEHGRFDVSVTLIGEGGFAGVDSLTEEPFRSHSRLRNSFPGQLRIRRANRTHLISRLSLATGGKHQAIDELQTLGE
jgi:hypothetical protein